MKSKIILTLSLVALLGLSSCGDKASSTETKEGTEATAKEAGAAPQTDANALQDLTMETPENTGTRAELEAAVIQEFSKMGLSNLIYDATSIKMKGQYAFYSGDVKNEDGTPFKGAGPHDDCCHVEALLQLAASQWVVLASSKFSTDVSYACWWKEHSAPKEIFPHTEDC